MILTPSRHCQDPSASALSQNPPAVPLISQACTAGAQQAARPWARSPAPPSLSRSLSRQGQALRPHPPPRRHHRAPGQDSQGSSWAPSCHLPTSRRGWDPTEGLRCGETRLTSFPSGLSAGEGDRDQTDAQSHKQKQGYVTEVSISFVCGGSPFSAWLRNTSTPHFFKSQA